MIKILNSIWRSEEITRNRKYIIYNIVKRILTYECGEKRDCGFGNDAPRRACGILRRD